MKKRFLIATDIDWDIDNNKVDLPSMVKIPKGINEEDVADYLSDEFGWCVNSFSISTP